MGMEHEVDVGCLMVQTDIGDPQADYLSQSAPCPLQHPPNVPHVVAGMAQYLATSGCELYRGVSVASILRERVMLHLQLVEGVDALDRGTSSMV